MILASLTIENVSLKNMAQILDTVEKFATEMGAGPDAVGDIALAVNEAVVNIIEHGYEDQPGDLEIIVERDGTDLIVKLWDNAHPFNPLSVPPPDTTLPLAQRQFGGMGVHMMRNFTDELSYQVTPEGKNELTLRKHHAFKNIS